MSFAQVASCMMGVAILLVMGELVVDSTLGKLPQHRVQIVRRHRSIQR